MFLRSARGDTVRFTQKFAINRTKVGVWNLVLITLSKHTSTNTSEAAEEALGTAVGFDFFATGSWRF